jgi:hypothetical protein
MQFHTIGIVLAALTVVSAASAQTTQAVEWKVSEGGNGHWYQLVISGQTTWPAARTASEERGGHLATVTSASEEAFIALLAARASHPTAWVDDQAVTAAGPWLGGYQPLGATSSQPWAWVNGEPWNWTGWAAGEPNGGFRPGDAWSCMLGFAGRNDYRGWADATSPDLQLYPLPVSFIVEWDADCNNDGLVDYGQILRGELIDLNANGVPDICETSVSSVIPPSVPSQGGSTIAIRGNGFQDNPTVRIGGVPAANIVRVSLTEITATSPALLPGMASVQVNDFTLQDGIYIRPDCGSDLDQNGAVDGGDMAILLLDWGPCYAPPSTLAAPAPTPLLVPDESTPASTPPAPQSARPKPQPRGTAS